MFPWMKQKDLLLGGALLLGKGQQPAASNAANADASSSATAGSKAAQSGSAAAPSSASKASPANKNAPVSKSASTTPTQRNVAGSPAGSFSVTRLLAMCKIPNRALAHLLDRDRIRNQLVRQQEALLGMEIGRKETFRACLLATSLNRLSLSQARLLSQLVLALQLPAILRSSPCLKLASSKSRFVHTVRRHPLVLLDLLSS
ncbi:hypothetical protein BOX15_Mlig029065g3 [Macrostomum lignano]|uniref:Uncharacterized protein n=1 Tax=Macrostomum lignano TaxID=282301 RepID=A0A267FS30_9PLAT|nr:hypothetical protein BOX15_Mlig029065g3 [Macrostomum lignano]